MKSRPMLVAAICLGLSMLLLGMSAHNISVVLPKAQAYSADGVSPVTTWDITSVIGTLLGGAGLGVGGVLAALWGVIQKSIQGALNKAGVSEEIADSAVDMTQIVAIQAAMNLVQDEGTKRALSSAGRLAFDSLRDRTFPVEA